MKKAILLWAIFILGVGTGLAQPHYRDRERKMAYKAARVNAMRQLAATIKKLRISSYTRVEDFVTENKGNRKSFKAFLKSVQQVGKPVYRDDNICELTLVVSLEQIIAWLKETRTQRPSRVVYSAKQFDQMRYYNDEKVFYVIGKGSAKRGLPQSTSVFWDNVTSQGKMMAKEAAKADACRKMGETIKEVNISSHTKIKDFVTANDEIRTAFNNFVQGAKFIGRPRYKPEGVIEVTARIEVDALILALSQICRRHYHGYTWRPSDFRNIRRTYPRRTIQVIGSGVPPARQIKKGNPEFPPFSFPSRQCKPKWAKGVKRATGTGVAPEHIKNPAQAKLMAKRAATVDAYRMMAEKVMGLKINSRTTVKDFVTQSDVIEGKFDAYIRAGQIVDTRYLPDGVVEVDVELYLSDVWELIQAYQKK